MNDGSTDNSIEILNEYSAKDSRIKVFSKKNGGASSARNYALSKVVPNPMTWISFIDSDDYVSPSMYSNIVESLNSTEDKAIDYVRLKSLRTSRRYDENVFTSANARQSLDYQLVDRGGYFDAGDVGGLIASLFVKSSIIMEHHILFNEEMHVLEDQIFSLRCAIHSHKIMILNNPCYYYYENMSSVSASSKESANDIIRCINFAYDILCNTGSKEIDRYFHKQYMPVKVYMLLSKILSSGRKPVVQIRKELKLWSYLKGIKAYVKYFMLLYKGLF